MEELENKTVLIVDDEQSNIYALKSYLETTGLNIIQAGDGQRAIQMLESNKTDLILLDMMMPVMDGYETLEMLKSREDLKNIPIIAVTARAMRGDKERCLEAGAWDYVSKPVNMNTLIDKIKQLI